MIELLKRLWESTSFRLTLNYSILAIFTTLFLIGFFYVQVFGALREEHLRQISVAVQRLSIAYEVGGREEVLRMIELTLSDRIDSGQEIYLLLDENKHTLVGNIHAIPGLNELPEQQVVEVQIKHIDALSEGNVRVTKLAGGETLVVGHELGTLNELRAMLSRIILTSMMLALMLVILGAYIFSSELKYHIGRIRVLTEQVGAGDISKRISSESEDIFGLIHHDINRMLDKIESLMQSARHISDTVAHNIRTPLTRIVGKLRETRNLPGVPAPVQQAQQEAIEEVEKLSVLLGKLLQIAELNAGVHRQSFKACNLEQIAEDVLDLYQFIAEEKGVRLHKKRIDAVTLNGDSNLLASALANIVDNAIKYARKNVNVGIERKIGHLVVISVEDDGPGLPESEYENVGKYFYRYHHDSEGFGLGLSSVSAIVELHRGELIFSKGESGLKVTIALPAPSFAQPPT
ncbi:MAG TPA: HAMP domain-containing sensor histidine kinase [Alcaligenes faecalis]|nr:HAMP domain-containing sensor histidine kinase [Alcaligenes faecalis]